MIQNYIAWDNRTFYRSVDITMARWLGERLQFTAVAETAVCEAVQKAVHGACTL